MDATGCLWMVDFVHIGLCVCVLLTIDPYLSSHPILISILWRTWWCLPSVLYEKYLVKNTKLTGLALLWSYVCKWFSAFNEGAPFKIPAFRRQIWRVRVWRWNRQRRCLEDGEKKHIWTDLSYHFPFFLRIGAGPFTPVLSAMVRCFLISAVIVDSVSSRRT